MDDHLDQQIEKIKTEVNYLTQLTDPETSFLKLDEVNNLIMGFLNQIQLLPLEQLQQYNQKLLEITPQIESSIAEMTRQKNELSTEIYNLNQSIKATKAYEQQNA
ncbi:hypothetical protein [Rickettsiales endosymbiont of Stachyamoeba lipophora]|uniref:hypothetical protein n=1 Tax=Rickettsiales endosymbiont of Stachyamoeba lipophora TaxID=2486578 RepID=UPI000F64640F|nr:hypothetical protein [Rickettsiales endosymbiont of Stachyamoeba lipophora]AZL15390.1 hypothetical protein EF513_02310 [Rickettsiales endosymbiont of Stachyamoeba lipophora]